jgi:hypothetical protein
MDELQKENIVIQEKAIVNVPRVVQEASTDNEILLVKFEKLKKFTESLNERYLLINNEGIRNDLSNTIIAASTVYEKIQDQSVKLAAKGLALAAIGKLHIEIDKL